MRIPLVIDVDSRDGSIDKDDRLTNILVEQDNSTALASVRPGLNTLYTGSGNGNGVVCFKNNTIHIFGTAMKRGTGPVDITTVVNETYDFSVML